MNMTEVRRGEEIIFCGQKVDSRSYEGPLWPFLKQRMESHRGATALVNPYTGEELSYRRVLSLTENLARGLTKLGLRQGKSLCIFSPNLVEVVLLNLAVLATGGVIHSVNPVSVAGELRRQLELTEAKIIATVPELLDPVKEAVADSDVVILTIGARTGYLNYDDLLTLGTKDVAMPTTFGDPSNDVATLLFSSGTTGLPKAVQSTQRNMMAFIHLVSIFEGGAMSMGVGDTFVCFMPLFHIYGIGLALNSLAGGSRLVIMTKFDMTDFLGFVTKYKATVLYLVPPVIVGMLSLPSLSAYDFKHVKYALSAAAPLGKEAQNQFEQKIGVPVSQGYGMTETLLTTCATTRKHKQGSCGIIFYNVECKIIDPETRKCLGRNQEGELYVRGPMNMKGYHKNPTATANTIDSQGWLDTGDIGKFDSDGFLFIVDRKKELIKYKGEQVAPAILEDLLLGHPGVSDACVIGRPDPRAGELPMAFVVAQPGHSLTSQQVQDYVAKQVPSYMQLRGGVEFRKEIPKSPSGKILRRLLRDELAAQSKSKL